MGWYQDMSGNSFKVKAHKKGNLLLQCEYYIERSFKHTCRKALVWRSIIRNADNILLLTTNLKPTDAWTGGKCLEFKKLHRPRVTKRRDVYSIEISNFCQFKLSTGLVGLKLRFRTLMNHNKVGSGLRFRTPQYFHAEQPGVISKENTSLVCRSQREDRISGRGARMVSQCWSFVVFCSFNFICFGNMLITILFLSVCNFELNDNISWVKIKVCLPLKTAKLGRMQRLTCSFDEGSGNRKLGVSTAGQIIELQQASEGW